MQGGKQAKYKKLWQHSPPVAIISTGGTCLHHLFMQSVCIPLPQHGFLTIFGVSGRAVVALHVRYLRNPQVQSRREEK